MARTPISDLRNTATEINNSDLLVMDQKNTNETYTTKKFSVQTLKEKLIDPIKSEVKTEIKNSFQIVNSYNSAPIVASIKIDGKTEELRVPTSTGTGDVSGKMDKVGTATSDNVAIFGNEGQVKDSGHAIFNGEDGEQKPSDIVTFKYLNQSSDFSPTKFHTVFFNAGNATQLEFETKYLYEGSKYGRLPKYILNGEEYSTWFLDGDEVSPESVFDSTEDIELTCIEDNTVDSPESRLYNSGIIY